MRIRIVRNVSAAENVCRSVRDQQSIFHIILDTIFGVLVIVLLSLYECGEKNTYSNTKKISILSLSCVLSIQIIKNNSDVTKYVSCIIRNK